MARNKNYTKPKAKTKSPYKDDTGKKIKSDMRQYEIIRKRKQQQRKKK